MLQMITLTMIVQSAASLLKVCLIIEKSQLINQKDKGQMPLNILHLTEADKSLIRKIIPHKKSKFKNQANQDQRARLRIRANPRALEKAIRRGRSELAEFLSKSLF